MPLSSACPIPNWWLRSIEISSRSRYKIKLRQSVGSNFRVEATQEGSHPVRDRSHSPSRRRSDCRQRRHPSRVLRTRGGDLALEAARLWQENPELERRLAAAGDLEQARESLFEYLDTVERRLLWEETELHPLEKSLARRAVRLLKDLFAPVSEMRTRSSAVEPLWRLARGSALGADEGIGAGFVIEFIHLFRAVHGRTGIYTGKGDNPEFFRLRGREAAEVRTEVLDRMATDVVEGMQRYISGLEPEVIDRRVENRARILEYFGGSDADWNDHVWQLRHVIRTPGPLLDLIDLSEDEADAVREACRIQLPFGITPYYLSLMDRSRRSPADDHAVRAQVIPPPDYVEWMKRHREDRDRVLDFMGERDTSPADLITRRYPMICILKPYNTCAQICVYCQRNWEIDECLVPEAMASPRALERALGWLDEHPGVGEVLVTGGDPCVMRTAHLRRVIEALAEKPQVFRIRVGTRTPVVLPMRWTGELIDMLAEFHEPGRREIVLVTHFEHSYEVTPEARDAVQRIRRAGIGICNQQVFTFENSRRFESVKLRRDLCAIGVAPYYTFNTKGKEETRHYRVPIARVLQEWKEEGRLLPGLDRTAQPVFNVPRLGKNQLRAGQDHRLVMIRPDGSRVYEFHPWEKGLAAVPPYLHVDVPIQEYLDRLADQDEDPEDYETIWYYY